MASPKYLIVTADDLGLHRGMNEGAARAHREGIVTTASVVANGREFGHAVELLKAHPALEAGIHLTFVEERPLSDSIARFDKSWRNFVVRYFARAVDFKALERELRLQVEKVLSTGLRVTHLNSHQHLHVLPRVWDIARRLAGEYRIGFVRVPLDHGGETRRMAMRMLGRLARCAQRKLPVRVQTIGIADAGHLTTSKLVRLMDEVEGVTELVTHPGVGDIASSYDWGYDWEQETAALCSPAVREAIRACGIELIKPSEALRWASGQQSAVSNQ